jgi:hypothetical protein
MKTPVHSIDEPEQRAPRADRPPTEGFVVIVDGHFKSEFDTVEAAQSSGRKLKSTYPMLKIEIMTPLQGPEPYWAKKLNSRTVLIGSGKWAFSKKNGIVG